MTEPLLLQTGSLPLDLEQRVDSLCDEFENALKRGTIPDPNEYLARAPQSAHRQLLRELANLLRSYVAGREPVWHTGQAAAAANTPSTLSDAECPKDVGDTTNAYLQRSLRILQQIDDAGARFEHALTRGELLSVEEIIASVDAAARPRLLRELLKLEMEFRAKKDETPSLRDYRARFPLYARLVKHIYFENLVPTQIGEFTIQRLLGRGGFGHVYQGWDGKLSRNVAIKVFCRNPEDMAGGGGLLFEARTAAQLCHPGIVTVYAVVQDEDGDEFLVLEYIDGRSLEDLLRSRRLSPHEAAEMMLAVVQSLQHAHEHGLVHRDLKPANILLDQGGRPRVTDFGLALHLADLRRSPDIAGTLPYMAPEQASGETHRLDARTDLWAVGITLYRSLTGWLPFSGASHQELLHAIRLEEPKDLLQHDPSIPIELARITRRCLSKRMSDRYQSAAELADDLREFLRPVLHPQQELAVRDSATVVPKGLRCFDESDREFFLQLVPGPRDRRNVPETVRFWERHFCQRDPDATFRVGLLYGPSGCGKSSLIRAGILPRLPRSVRSFMVEATCDETESHLASGLRRQFPEITASTPATMLAELREGSRLPPGDKVLIVIDQFEQWLHGWRHDEESWLIEALRQCDGGRVQAVVLVRDDFWMPATRFFRQLDIPLQDGLNALAVDLFDKAHGKAVLDAFGVAYGRLPKEASQRTAEQQRFLEQAIHQLAVDGWIVPVQLCIFVEMIKTRPWTPATLRDVGGTQGLGTAFLQQMFDGRSASPAHRLHRGAVRRVLERLLPPGGGDIRGHLVADSELRDASGYQHDPAEFAALMRCLDQELRLVTPSEAEMQGPRVAHGPRLYQLTHDFLVAAIRGWLNQTRRRTIRGRAELRLIEYANAYAARPEARQLPSWWEWLSVLAFTNAWRWKRAERSMMCAASRYFFLRHGLGVLGLALLAIVVYDRMGAVQAEGVVQALATADSRDLPTVAALLPSHRQRARTLLAARLATQPPDSEQYVRLLLGLVALQERRTDELLQQLLASEPSLTSAIAQVLLRCGQLDALEPQLWEVAMDSQAPPDRRLRACLALAPLKPHRAGDKWNLLAATLAVQMLSDSANNPAHFADWLEGFAPIRRWLAGPLQQSFADAKRPDPERLLAANALVRYLADDREQLIELALQATPRQFDVLAKKLARHRAEVEARAHSELQVPIPDMASEDEKDRLARRQVNALLLLHGFGEGDRTWEAMSHRPDPRLRSFALDHFRTVHPSCESWMNRLSTEPDPGVRQAIVLVLGSIGQPLPDTLRHTLLQLYRDDPDAGVHSACEWALRHLGSGDDVEQALTELSRQGIRSGCRWYVTKSRITMTIFEGSDSVLLGSPASEPDRDASDEAQFSCPIDWSFAVSSKEITQAQFFDVCEKNPRRLNESAPEEDCPVNAVTWLDAAKFCRLLSERDGFLETEMAVPSADNLRKPTYPDFLAHTGYRLPSEVEWELACRAGSSTARSYGFEPRLLPQYACYLENSSGRSRAVGQGWPNADGLFDMLGNVSEWCLDNYLVQPEKTGPSGSWASGSPGTTLYGVVTTLARRVESAPRTVDRSAPRIPPTREDFGLPERFGRSNRVTNGPHTTFQEGRTSGS